MRDIISDGWCYHPRTETGGYEEQASNLHRRAGKDGEEAGVRNGAWTDSHRRVPKVWRQCWEMGVGKYRTGTGNA